MIEAMITFVAVQDITRIGLFGQSLFSSFGGSSQGSNMKTGLEAETLSNQPSEEVHDNVLRVSYAWKPDSMSLGSGFVLFRGMKNSHPWLILGTEELHRYHNAPSGRVGGIDG